MKTPLLLSLLLLILGSCAMDEIPERLIPKDANRFVVTYIDTLTKGNIGYCHDKLQIDLQGENAINQLASLHDSLKTKQIKNSRIISTNWTTQLNATTTSYNLTYEYEYTDNSWMYHSFDLIEENQQFTVLSFFINPQQQSMSQRNAFSLHGKNFLHYLWLVCAACVLLFIIATLIFAIITPMKKKWFWILIILLGLGSFPLNWTTGYYSFNPLAFQILGVSFLKAGPVHPWVLSFSVPAGAFLFWIIRFQQKSKVEGEDKFIQAAKIVDTFNAR